MEYHQDFVTDNFEGTMVRSGGDEPYRMQYRSPSLLKLKDFMDEHFLVVGMKEGVGKAEGTAILRCALPNGGEFDVRCKGTDSSRKYQWDHPEEFINRYLTVKFQNYSDSGCPIFPVGMELRDPNY
jgi:ATP-dependent DNA ligase